MYVFDLVMERNFSVRRLSLWLDFYQCLRKEWYNQIYIGIVNRVNLILENYKLWERMHICLEDYYK